MKPQLVLRLIAFGAAILGCPGLSVDAQTATGEAYFEVASPPGPGGESFVIRLTEPSKIKHARDIIAGRVTGAVHVMGTVVKAPAFYNRTWNFHLDPRTIRFFSFTVELCDAAASYVESNLNDVGGELFLPDSLWCPWASRPVRELPAPPDAATAVTTVSSASFFEIAVAPDSIAAALGRNLAARTLTAPGPTLPETLGGVTVRVRDSLGRIRPAQIFSVSRGQVTYLVPAGTASGVATVILRTSDKRTLTGMTRIEEAAPGLFGHVSPLEPAKMPWAMGKVVRVRADGSRVDEPIARVDPSTGLVTPVRIDFGPTSDRLFLELKGTGFRAASATALILEDGFRVVSAGPQGGSPGLDQLTLALSRSLAGLGEIQITLLVDSDGHRLASNPVRLLF